VLESSKHKTVLNDELNVMMGFAGDGIYNWVLAGLGYISKEMASKELKQYNQEEQGRKDYEYHMEHMDLISKDFMDNTEFIELLRASRS
jgi:hypothetical protein